MSQPSLKPKPNTLTAHSSSGRTFLRVEVDGGVLFDLMTARETAKDDQADTLVRAVATALVAVHDGAYERPPCEDVVLV